MGDDRLAGEQLYKVYGPILIVKAARIETTCCWHEAFDAW